MAERFSIAVVVVSLFFAIFDMVVYFLILLAKTRMTNGERRWGGALPEPFHACVQVRYSLLFLIPSLPLVVLLSLSLTLSLFLSLSLSFSHSHNLFLSLSLSSSHPPTPSFLSLSPQMFRDALWLSLDRHGNITISGQRLSVYTDQQLGFILQLVSREEATGSFYRFRKVDFVSLLVPVFGSVFGFGSVLELV